MSSNGHAPGTTVQTTNMTRLRFLFLIPIGLSLSVEAQKIDSLVGKWKYYDVYNKQRYESTNKVRLTSYKGHSNESQIIGLNGDQLILTLGEGSFILNRTSISESDN